MNLQIKIEASSAQAAQSIQGLSLSFAALGASITNAGKSLDRFSKQAKRFGSDFTRNITAPIAALAGLGLKKIFDEAVDSRGSAAMNEFAVSVQRLKKSFDELLITIGLQFAPVATAIANSFNNLIRIYQSLDAETKKLITNFALGAAAIGPLVLAFSAFLSIGGKILIALGGLVKVFGSLVGVLTSPVSIIIALGVSLAGLVNIFIKLRQTGSEWGEAFMQVLFLVSATFSKYITGTILDGVGLITQGLSKLFGLFDKDLAEAMNGATETIRGWSAGLDSTFDQAKTEIDSQLSSIGSSAGDAFTFGFSTKIGEAVNSFKEQFSNLTEGGEGGNVFTKFDERVKETSDALKANLASGLSDAMIDFAEGTESAGRAFEKFAQSFLRQIAKMIIQAQILRILQSSMPGLFPGAAAATAPVTAATGGYISGPGTGTSDSIPARLSNGEYVVRAAAVKKYGVDFFHNLNRMKNSGFSRKSRGGIPGFADGGLVSSPGQAPQVVIQNSGTPKEATSTNFDPSTGVTTVILDDISRNGPIAKSIQNNFGVKRGNFR